MTGTKHPKSDSPFADDESRNPGIGQSKGSFATGEKPSAIEGENTVEGDVENNADAAGWVKEDLGRTNR